MARNRTQLSQHLLVLESNQQRHEKRHRGSGLKLADEGSDQHSQ